MLKNIYNYIKIKYFAFRDKKRLTNHWKVRISDVINCPDNAFIPRVPNAGEIKNGIQIMHNGLKIYEGSYYGEGIAAMLKKNNGVHEPQEEKIFLEVLKELDNNDVVILELGCYWAFYSMWFLKECKNGKAYLVEPDLENLKYGENNFKLNNFEGNFLQGLVGKEYIKNETISTYNIDYLINKWELKLIDILHCDIQGEEYNMLQGISEKHLLYKIKYFFISTHSNKIHSDCKLYLASKGYDILADINLDETYSFDGILVGKNKIYPGLNHIEFSKKNFQ